MLREALSTAPHRFHQQSGSTPHDAGTIDPPPHRPPPFWLAVARQRPRLHRRATPARSPTPNPLARPAQIPIALAAPPGAPPTAISCLGAFRTPAASARGKHVLPASENLHISGRHVPFLALGNGVNCNRKLPMGRAAVPWGEC